MKDPPATQKGEFLGFRTVEAAFPGLGAVTEALAVREEVGDRLEAPLGKLRAIGPPDGEPVDLGETPERPGAVTPRAEAPADGRDDVGVIKLEILLGAEDGPRPVTDRLGDGACALRLLMAPRFDGAEDGELPRCTDVPGLGRKVELDEGLRCCVGFKLP